MRRATRSGRLGATLGRPGGFLSLLAACALVGGALAGACSGGDGGESRYFGAGTPGNPPSGTPPDPPPPGTTTNPYGVRRYTLGAYYYPWWTPEEWEKGVHGEPRIGWYESKEPVVAGVHITDAAEAGVGVLAVEWYAAHSDLAIQLGLLQAPNLDQIQFCMFYDVPIRFGLVELKLDLDKPIPRLAFVRDIHYVAETYMSHPSYFRIDGRPVIIIYLSRALAGDVPGVFDLVREDLAAIGIDPYIIGDEVWVGDADPARLAAFDAVTAYNLYNQDVIESLGISGVAGWTEFVRQVYQGWSERAQEVRVHGTRRRLDFHPGAIPQYNDTAVRPGNPPLPASSPEDLVGMLEMCKSTALPVGDSDTGLIWINSWNEWHEGTTVEPTADGDGIVANGYYGFGFLDALRSAFGGS